MTEEEWLAGRDPFALIDHLGHPPDVSERKVMLVGCACCAGLWDVETFQPARDALEVAVRFIEGEASEDDLRAAGEAAWLMPDSAFFNGVRGVVQLCRRYRWSTVRAAATAPVGLGRRATDEERAARLARFAGLIREVFGSPFRPVAFDPAWRTADAAMLATGIYADRAFDRLPILADALQDAGCDAEELLAHLRDPHAAHVRGCWALDLVLGKR